jgi:hypothetical protein
MTAPTAGSTLPIPSEPNDGVDDVTLPFRHVWAYPSKLLLWSRLQQVLDSAQQLPPPLAGAGVACGTWRYITNLHLPPRAAPDFRSREDPEERVWTYNFKDNTGKVSARTGRQRQMDEDLQGGGEERWCDVEGN